MNKNYLVALIAVFILIFTAACSYNAQNTMTNIKAQDEATDVPDMNEKVTVPDTDEAVTIPDPNEAVTAPDPNDVTIISSSSGFPFIYRDVDGLASRATDIVRAVVLDERVEEINIWLSSNPTPGEVYRIYTVYRVEVLEVFQGPAESGDILEVKQRGGQIGNVLYKAEDVVPLEINDELVLFLESYREDDIPASPLNYYQATYRVLPTGGFESINSLNDLTLTVEDLEEISAINLDITMPGLKIDETSNTITLNTIKASATGTSIFPDSIFIEVSKVNTTSKVNTFIDSKTITLDPTGVGIYSFAASPIVVSALEEQIEILVYRDDSRAKLIEHIVVTPITLLGS